MYLQGSIWSVSASRHFSAAGKSRGGVYLRPRAHVKCAPAFSSPGTRRSTCHERLVTHERQITNAVRTVREAGEGSDMQGHRTARTSKSSLSVAPGRFIPLGFKDSGKGLGADGIRMEFGFPCKTEEPEKSYFLKSFFLPKPARPTRPEPRRSMVAGSGTGLALTVP